MLHKIIIQCPFAVYKKSTTQTFVHKTFVVDFQYTAQAHCITNIPFIYHCAFMAGPLLYLSFNFQWRLFLSKFMIYQMKNLFNFVLQIYSLSKAIWPSFVQYSRAFYPSVRSIRLSNNLYLKTRFWVNGSILMT